MAVTKTFGLLPRKLSSAFALLDIQIGREKIAKLVEQGYVIPFTVSGYIQADSRAFNDDGQSIEFGADVEELILTEPVRREFASLASLAEGDVVELDGGFTCVTKAQCKARTLGRDDVGLYFECKEGKHYLDGQTDDDSDKVVGVYTKKRQY